MFSSFVFIEKIDKEVIDRGIKLKYVARAGAGIDNLDLEYLNKIGVEAINAPEGNRDAVGDHTVGMLLVLLNKMHTADRQVRQLVWDREGNRGTELHNKTVGIIGYGNMGSAFAERLPGFGCKVLAYDKYKSDFSDQFIFSMSHSMNKVNMMPLPLLTSLPRHLTMR